IGKQSDSESGSRTFGRLVLDAWRFSRALDSRTCDIVHLNPSVGPKALIRDGILLLIAKARRKAAVVFVHGWDESFESSLAAPFVRLFAFVYHRADAFIVLSEEIKGRLRRL